MSYEDFDLNLPRNPSRGEKFIRLGRGGSELAHQALELYHNLRAREDVEFEKETSWLYSVDAGFLTLLFKDSKFSRELSSDYSLIAEKSSPLEDGTVRDEVLIIQSCEGGGNLTVEHVLESEILRSDYFGRELHSETYAVKPTEEGLELKMLIGEKRPPAITMQNPLPEVYGELASIVYRDWLTHNL